MGKLTSTIGIPIKLLNEAQVSNKPRQEKHKLTRNSAQGHVVTLELTSGQVYRGKLLEGILTLNHPHAFLPRNSAYPDAHSFSIHTNSPFYSRRQHECPAQGHYRHGARRPSITSRSSLHPRKPRAILHCTRHAPKCTHVQITGNQRSWCWSGERKSYGQSGTCRTEAVSSEKVTLNMCKR